MRDAPRVASGWLSELAVVDASSSATGLGRIVQSSDFERVLKRPACARSTHFAVHFVAEPALQGLVPTRPQPLVARGKSQVLSTEHEQSFQQPVDESLARPADPPLARQPAGVFLGTAVPKRFARRAVTRTLIKRQIRAAAQRLASAPSALRPGWWVVRLRAPFERSAFRSAASDALRATTRQELDALLLLASRRCPAAAPAMRHAG